LEQLVVLLLLLPPPHLLLLQQQAYRLIQQMLWGIAAVALHLPLLQAYRQVQLFGVVAPAACLELLPLVVTTTLALLHVVRLVRLALP
jgi:hypothetical protein